MSDSDFEDIISDPDKYADKINQIGIPHGGANRGTDALTEAEQSILRSELWGLIRIARIARPGAIYDASAAEQTFTECEIADFQIEGAALAKAGEEENNTKREK